MRDDQRAMRWPRGLGRLAGGATLESAQAELDALGGALAEQYPETNGDWRPRLAPYRDFVTEGLAPHLRSLFALTWVFVALAAVNLAGLQLARGAARTTTFALQRALGASGSRLGRQLLLETLLLTLPGALAGIALAHGLLALLPGRVTATLPPWLDLRVGAAEIGFASATAVLVALIAGLAPLWIGRRVDLRGLLAGRSGSAARGGRMRHGLVVAEVSLAVVLLVAAGLLARSLGTLEQVEPGFAAEQVVSVELSPQVPGSYLEQTERQRLAVRLEGSPAALMPSLRRALEDAAPETGVVEILSLASILDESLWQSRLLGRLAPLFAATALLLAGLGVYGLLAHDLAQKRHELGVRAALGAPRGELARRVLWGGLQLVALGVAGGLVVSLVTTPLLAASLFGVEARDPSSFVLAVIALLVAGVVACLAPAWRATRIHPTEALREA